MDLTDGKSEQTPSKISHALYPPILDIKEKFANNMDLNYL